MGHSTHPAWPKTRVSFLVMNARQLFPRPHLLAASLVALAAIFASPLHAQVESQPIPSPVQSGAQKLSAEELGHLLAPVALYPDALIALVLPASTVPADVVLGARYLKSGGDPAQVEKQPWDESVKSLARYPDVLAWMDANLEWTSSLGEAFVEQPADVMNAVQALREQAKAAGNLADTPQQKVVEDESAIRIVPADPEVIYVPQYDPQVVYVYSSVVVFGPGFFVGPWLCYDFDWRRRCFYHGHWRGWNQHNQWGHEPIGNGAGAHVMNIDMTNANPWQPSAGARRQISQRQANNNGNARYVNARPGTASTPTAQPGFYNPALKTALPQPSKFERFPIGHRPDQAPVRTATPANNPPANVAPSPKNVRAIPEASPARPTRTVPSTAPQVPGQINSPGLPGGTNEPRHPKQPDRFTPETPAPGDIRGPESPATAPVIQPGRSEPPRVAPPRATMPAAIEPTQAAPVIQQPPQIQERQQFQPQERPQRQQVQEPPSPPRGQVQQPDRPQQRQPLQETVNAPAVQQHPAPDVSPQAQGRPVPAKKKPEEKKAE